MTSLSIPALAVNHQTSSEADYAKVSKIMVNYSKDKAAAKKELKKLGYELVSEPEVTTLNARPTSEITPSFVSPSSFTLSVYSFKKAGQSLTSLQFTLQTSQKEYSPGPLDYVSLEYNQNLASYYTSAGDGNITTVQGRGTGIVTFNLEDSKLTSTNYTYGTVNILPRTPGSTLEYGSKYCHTYKTTSSSGGTIGGALNLSPLPSNISGGGSFEVNLVTAVECFYLWADNASTI